MRYLRMLSNSMAAAALATSYVIALVLHLNPNLPLHPLRLAPLVATVGLYYVVHLTVIFYILLVLRQLFAREVFSPAWISVDVLTWLSALAAAAGAALMWRNLVTFSLVLDPPTTSALERSTIVLALPPVCVWCWRVLAPRRCRTPGGCGRSLLVVRHRRVGGGAARRCAAAACRRCSRRGPSTRRSIARGREVAGRVTVIAIDAASLDLITRATAEGRLPNFGRILDAGAVRHLATLHPTSAEAVWAAVATGKLPQKNGVRSSASTSSPAAAARCNCCRTTASRTASSVRLSRRSRGTRPRRSGRGRCGASSAPRGSRSASSAGR